MSSLALSSIVSLSSNDSLPSFSGSALKSNCARMVVMEMCLALLGIIFNLIVLISIRERESLLKSTLNVILASLSAANLVLIHICGHDHNYAFSPFFFFLASACCGVRQVYCGHLQRVRGGDLGVGGRAGLLHSAHNFLQVIESSSKTQVQLSNL